MRKTWLATLAFAAGIFSASAEYNVNITVKDWTGKTVSTVQSKTAGGTFSFDTKAFFGGTVDYVSAFDGATVSKTPTSTYASSSIVTWKNITNDFSTEVFVQPYVPVPAKDLAAHGSDADPYVVQNPNNSSQYFLASTESTYGLKVRTLTVNSGSSKFTWGTKTDCYSFPSHSTAVDGWTQCCWAPELHYIDGKWYAYISSSDTGSNGPFREFAMSQSGSSPKTSTGWSINNLALATGVTSAIDLTILNDGYTAGSSDKLYALYSGVVGKQSICIQKMSTPTAFADTTYTKLSAPEYDWEKSVNEGAAVIRHGSKVHVVYSGGQSWNTSYCLGLLTAEQGSDYLVKSNWKKSPTSIFSLRKGAYGPGHCSFTKIGEYDLICYHATTNTADGWNNRSMRYQPVAWHNDDPVLGAPRPVTFTSTADNFDLDANWAPASPITKTIVSLPYNQTATYNGNARSPKYTTNEYCRVKSGAGSWTSVGTHNIVYTLNDSTTVCWADGTTADKTVTFQVTKATNAWIVEPTMSNYGVGDPIVNFGAPKCGTVTATYDLAALTALPEGTYTNVFTVTETSDYTGLSKSIKFIVGKPMSPMDNPAWGYRITGLGDNSDEIALVFTNTAETMSFALPDNVQSIRYLVVAGGGSGGATVAKSGNKYNASGGGGAGGMLTNSNYVLTSRSVSVTVGTGGAAVSSVAVETVNQYANGITGSNSVLRIGTDEIIAHGGGGGGGNASGKKGGSGGGSGTSWDVTRNGGACYDGEGNAGGNSGLEKGGGGGGGAGGAGTSTTAATGGTGGAGRFNDITGASIRYAAGGGGGVCGSGTQSAGAGGTGGGGAGTKYSTGNTKAGDGTYYGCGGGGTAGYYSAGATHTSGAGYQGIVIIRYVVSNVPPGHVHSWGAWTTNSAPTCTAAGERTHYCVADGCTEPVASESEPVAALGHDLGDWYTYKAAEICVAGEKRRNCSRCDYYESETIPALPDPHGGGPEEFGTNAMANASWGYEIHGLGTESNEVALVFTNTTETMNWTLPSGVTSIRYLVVAGGGSGGTSAGRSKKDNGAADTYLTSGGGGAGGMFDNSEYAIESSLITVTVGAGGAPVSVQTDPAESRSAQGNDGGDSTLTVGSMTSIVAHGGGGGGGNGVGRSGGSGGGAGTRWGARADSVFDGGTGISGEGNAGGQSISSSSKSHPGGGGGGAGGPGSGFTVATTAYTTGGSGGAGRQCDITGVNSWYSAGGGGAGYGKTGAGGAGGQGGGGAGAKFNETTDVVAGSGKTYGSGGGGAPGFSVYNTSYLKTRTSGAGKQGVVIVRYKRVGGPLPAKKGIMLLLR